MITTHTFIEHPNEPSRCWKCYLGPNEKSAPRKDHKYAVDPQPSSVVHDFWMPLVSGQEHLASDKGPFAGRIYFSSEITNCVSGDADSNGNFVDEQFTED